MLAAAFKPAHLPDGVLPFIGNAPTDGAGRIKIGFTDGDPETRIAALATSSPFPIRVIHSIPGDVGREREIHEAFGDDRASGEWFNLSLALRTFLAEITTSLDPDAVIKAALTAHRATWAERKRKADAFAAKAVELVRACAKQCSDTHGATAIAAGLGRDPTSVRNWANGRTAMSFDSFAALMKADPDSFAPLAAHFANVERAEDAPSIPERLNRLRREIDAIQREAV